MADDRIALFYAAEIRQTLARIYVQHTPDLGYRAATEVVRGVCEHVQGVHSTRDAIRMLSAVEHGFMHNLPMGDVLLPPETIPGAAEPAAAPPTVSSEGAALASRVRARLKRDAPAAFSAFRWVVIGVIIGLTWASLTG